MILVLFDMPPVVSVTDAQIMATKTDGVVFVVRRGIAHTDDVKHAKELLDMVQANVLGSYLMELKRKQIGPIHIMDMGIIWMVKIND